jgi:hypothetical protein
MIVPVLPSFTIVLVSRKKSVVLYELGESEVQEIYYSGRLTRLLVLLWINALLLVSMANSTSTTTDSTANSTSTILGARGVPIKFRGVSDSSTGTIIDYCRVISTI